MQLYTLEDLWQNPCFILEAISTACKLRTYKYYICLCLLHYDQTLLINVGCNICKTC